MPARILIGVALCLMVSRDSVETADDNWIEARSANAIVLSNAGAETARLLVQQLEEMRGTLRHLAGDSFVEPFEPVVVLAVRGDNGLRELLPQFWERRGQRPVAAASPGPYTPYVAMRTDIGDRDRRRVLFHEYVHLISRETIADLPMWLDEGLSEFWSSIQREGNGINIASRPPRHLRALKSRRWIPLQDLMTIKRGQYGNNRAQIEMLYAQSWALTHYLLLSRSGSERIAYAPRDIPGNPSSLEREVRSYILGGQPFKRVLQARTLPVAHISTRVLASSESRAWRGAFLVHGERPDAAVPLLELALRDDARNAVALESMGTYYFITNRPDLAKKWLSHALEMPSASYRAHYYYAILASDVHLAKRHLLRTLELRPGFGPAVERLRDLR